MMDYQPRKTRIDYRRSTDETFLQVLPEDLQTDYNAALEATDEKKRAAEDLSHNLKNPDFHKAFFLSRRKEYLLHYDFWIKFRDRFNNWIDPLAVRDGYEVVKIKPVIIAPYGEGEEQEA